MAACVWTIRQRRSACVWTDSQICVDGWNRLNAGNLRYDAVPNGELWERLANLLKHSENDLRLEKVYSHVQRRTTALQDWEYVNNGAADVAAKATVHNRPPELLACHARLHDQVRAHGQTVRALRALNLGGGQFA